MSTAAIGRAVVATTVQYGMSDLATIRINVSEVAPSTSASRTTLVFVTYDSMNQAFEMSGRYGTTRSMQEFTPWGSAQSAMLLIARSPVPNEVVLSIVPSLPEPVTWRAVAIVIDAQTQETRVPAVVPMSGPYTLPDASDDPDNEHAMMVAFFASAQESPTMSNTGPKLGVEVNDGQHWIEGYVWNQLGAVALGDGPWFYTEVRLTWNNAITRPPPTTSDDYWATPAACQAADVILINDNQAAPTWDAEDSHVFTLPDTLLLNFTAQDGTRWMLNDLDGWWTLPPAALPDLPRPGYLDGSFPVDGRYEPRVITMRGTFWPGPNVSASVPRLRLLRALDAVRGGALLVVKEPVWPKHSWVWLSDQPRVHTVNGMGVTEFEVQLKAIDPIKYHSGQDGLRRYDLEYAGSLDGRDYSQDVQVGQRFEPNPRRRFTADLGLTVATEVVNAGTSKVYPRFFIYGPATNAAITNATTGQRMVFQGTIQAGKMLLVDCYWRIAVLANAASSLATYGGYGDLEGENRRWMLRLSSPWIHLQPGVNDLFYQASDVIVPVPPEAEPMAEDEIPLDLTQCWIMFRSGWAGS